MQRDLDLIRQILLEVEKHDDPLRAIPVGAEGHSAQEISHHVMLLKQAGYVTATDLSHLRGLAWTPKSLTWEGHEFLEAARNPTIWDQVKATLQDRVVDTPLSVIQKLATRLVSKGASL